MSQTTTEWAEHRLPASDDQFNRVRYYIEDDPVAEYHHASPQAYEAFRDIKYGIRIHWGVYTLKHLEASWNIVTSFNDQQRQEYQQLYRQFNPKDFDAEKWMEMFERFGLRMFAFTAKHQDGFSLFDTKTRVKQRVNWTAAKGQVIEDCDVAYSVMESPIKRDIVAELCAAARKRNIKIDLYCSHPDWYDADFRGYGLHPMQTPEYREHPERYGNGTGVVDAPVMIGPDPTDHQTGRMMRRYGDQLKELLTNYGKVDMICFDQWLGPKVWPKLREILIALKKIQPDAMFRARGIGNYGDYYTPEDFVPGDKEPTSVPWFVIDRLAKLFSFDPDASHYRDAKWILHQLISSVAKGGNFMVSIGPDENGDFHPKALEAPEEVGAWLKINGQAIYATRPRDGSLWHEDKVVHFTRTKDRKFVYAICQEWPGKVLSLKTVKANPGSVIHLLGTSQSLKWRAESGVLTIDIPDSLQDEKNRPCRLGWVFRIESSI